MFLNVFKLFQVLILSLSLLNFNSMAVAQSQNSGASGSTTNSTSPSSLDKSTLKGAGDDNMLNSITMIAIGFVASRLWKYSPMKADVMVAAAGGASFLIGEISSTGKFDKIDEDKSVYSIDSATADKNQLEFFNKLKKSYEDAKVAAQTKETYQKTAGAAFLVAAAMALMMKGLEITAEATSTTALSESAAAAGIAAAEATASCVYGVGCIFITPCTTAATTFAADVARRKAMNLARDTVVSPSLTCQATDAPLRTELLAEVTPLGVSCPAAGAAPPALVAEDTTQLLNNSAGTPDMGNMANIDFNTLPFNKLSLFRFYENVPKSTANPNYFDKLLNLAFPKVEAGTINLLMGGSGAAAGLLISTMTSLSVTVDTFIFAPKNRAMLWGMLGGLSLLASKSTSDAISTMDDNIKKIDKIVSFMKSVESAKTVTQVTANLQTQTLSGNVDTGKGSELVLSTDATNKTPCLANTGESSCTSLATQIETSGNFSQLPTALRAVASDFARMGDGFSGVSKISASVSALVNSNGNQLNAIKKLLDTAKSDVNKLMVKNGNQKIDFDKEQSNLQVKFGDEIKNVLSKNGTTASKFLASMGASQINSTKIDKATDATSKVQTAKNAIIQASVNTSAKPATKEKLLLNEDKDLVKENAAVADNKNQKLDDFELKNNDINTDKDVSLFELISNRYKLSAYPKLFKKIE